MKGMSLPVDFEIGEREHPAVVRQRVVGDDDVPGLGVERAPEGVVRLDPDERRVVPALAERAQDEHRVLLEILDEEQAQRLASGSAVVRRCGGLVRHDETRLSGRR